MLAYYGAFLFDVIFVCVRYVYNMHAGVHACTWIYLRHSDNLVFPQNWQEYFMVYINYFIFQLFIPFYYLLH